MPNFLPSNLVILRKVFRISQSRLASEVNKGQTTIGNWENKISQPSVEDLLIIKQFFDISLDHLVETDLSGVELSELREIAKRPGNVALKGSKRYQVQDADALETMLNDPGSTQAWLVMKVLKDIDGKVSQVLEKVLDLSKNKPGEGAQ